MVVALETAKQYLRVDTNDEDNLINSMIGTAEKLCRDILRINEEDVLSTIPEIEIAVLYAIAYLYEHREEADHSKLMDTLRSLLSGDRKELF
ncbi:MAG TPA: head-tail connector protein [Lachnospiraceae bacterium]|nr:head-tail connector protein [Lachnospiraceae bacterium]